MRQTILNKARSTTADVKPRKPVRRWFDLGLPWNSALASVLVVGFVTVLWKTQEPPPEVLQVQAPRPTATPQASAPIKAQAAQAARADAQREASALQKLRPPQLAKPLPPVRIAESATPSAEVAAPPPPTVVIAPAPVAVPAPVPLSRFAAPAPAAEKRARDSAADPGWTELRVLLPAEPVTWARNQLPAETVARLQSVLSATPVENFSEAKAAPPQLSLQLRRGDQLLGYLELGLTEARWIPVDGPIVRTRPTGLPELIEALKQER